MASNRPLNSKRLRELAEVYTSHINLAETGARPEKKVELPQMRVSEAILLAGSAIVAEQERISLAMDAGEKDED